MITFKFNNLAGKGGILWLAVRKARVVAKSANHLWVGGN